MCKECKDSSFASLLCRLRLTFSAPPHSLNVYSEVLAKMNNRAICSARRREPFPRHITSLWFVARTAGWSRVPSLPTQCRLVHSVYYIRSPHSKCCMGILYMVSDNTVSEVNVWMLQYCTARPDDSKARVRNEEAISYYTATERCDSKRKISNVIPNNIATLRRHLPPPFSVQTHRNQRTKLYVTSWKYVIFILTATETFNLTNNINLCTVWTHIMHNLP